MNKDNDIFLEQIKHNGYYSNTTKQTKWFDGIDLTIGRNFREVKNDVNKHNNISLFSDNINYIIEKSTTRIDYSGRFFYQDRLNEEVEFYRKHGCECCGGPLIMPIEISYGLCSECDRRMFSKTKARSAFPELSERNTCCPKEFYKFVDKIDKIENHTQSIWTFLLKMFVRNKNTIEKDKHKWHPYLKFVHN